MREVALKKLKNLDRPVMITGHTGFKGTWLTLLLESQGIEVSGLSLRPEEDSLFSRLERSGKIHEQFLDIRDFNSVNSLINSVKPSVIFHMAAQPLVLQSYTDPRGTFETNVMGTANILESVSGLTDRSYVVAITTDKVYENLETGRKFKEEDKLHGKDPYSASKVGTESVVAAWKNIWTANNSHKICSVRAGNVIGGGDFAKARLIPDIIRGIQQKTSIEIRNPASSRPWQHVLDPLFGYVSSAVALIDNVKLDAVNFGPSEKSLTVEDVITIARKEFGKEASRDS
jgi:CDP-glucose 4,6-dehydratase